jgi:hypothetical protein
MRTLIPLLLAAWLTVSAGPALAQHQDPTQPAPTTATATSPTDAAQPTVAVQSIDAVPTDAAVATNAAIATDPAVATDAALATDPAVAKDAAQPTAAVPPNDAALAMGAVQTPETAEPTETPESAEPIGPALAIDDPAPIACDTADGRQRYLEVRGSGFDAWALQRLQGAVLDGDGQPRMSWSSVWVSPQGRLTLEIGLCPSAFRGRDALAPGSYTVLIDAGAGEPIATTPIDLAAPPTPPDTTNPDEPTPIDDTAPPPPTTPAPIAPTAPV